MAAQALTTIALTLLVASGISKLKDPAPTVGALRAAKLPSSQLGVRALGVLEIITSLGALAVGGVFLWATALLYAGFAGFVIAALRGHYPLQSCGCFGRDDTPPTIMHAGFNVVSAIALAAVALRGETPIPWDLPTTVLALVAAYGLVGAYLSWLLLSRAQTTMVDVY